jgi:hypothetical protein
VERAAAAPGANLFLAGDAGLRWFRERTALDRLACSHGISPTTAHWYLDDVITVLTDETSVSTRP